MIIISKSVYKKFLKFALENANPFSSPRNWKECIGLVLGRIHNQELQVTDIVPIDSGTNIFVDINNYEKVFSLISVNRIDQGEVIIGWAHTHPGLGLFFSNTDINTQKLYQQIYPLAFGMVLDPTKITAGFAGFNIYRVDKTNSHAKSVEYHIDESFDFLNTKQQLIEELFIKPVIPTEEIPIIHSDSEVSWKNIRIKLIGPTNVKLKQYYKLKLKVRLLRKQHIRIKYKISTDQLSEDPFSLNLIYNRNIFHETFTSGTLAIYTLHSLDVGTTQIKLTNIQITDFMEEYVEMPELRLTTQIQQ